MDSRIDTTSLANLVRMHTRYDGEFPLRVPGVYAIRISKPSEVAMHGVQQMSACIVVGGSKRVTLGDNAYDYHAGQVAVYSIDLPILWQITEASEAEPYLVLRLDLRPERIVELAAKVFPHGAPAPKETRAVYIADADTKILDAATRLVELMDDAADADLLGTLVIDEILIRLLRGPMGSRIAQLGQAESSLHRVATAVLWLRENFDQPVDVEELAKRVNMSASNFHRQFKSVTSMSPVQFQKSMRLQEARRLMLTARLDAGSAGRRVGYLSASQFTREYARFFGSPPMKDIQRLQAHGVGLADTAA